MQLWMDSLRLRLELIRNKMKRIFNYFFAIACAAMNAFNPSHAMQNDNGAVLDYSLKLSLSKDVIRINLENKSPVKMRIRKDALPSSLLIRGIQLYAFVDSEEFTPVPLFIPMGSNPELISILPGEHVLGEIKIKRILRNGCDILSVNPIIVFWLYSAKSDKNVLPASNGIFRIKREDVTCD